MGRENIQAMENKIRNASPLELAAVLQEAELYDKKDTQTVIDEVYESLKMQGGLVEEVVVPIFMSVADGFLESTSATRKLRKKGLTASRILNECRNFSYDQKETYTISPDAYAEWKNADADLQEYAENTRPAYNRTSYENQGSLNKYKNDKFANNGGRINAYDEYTGKKNVYQSQANPDARRNIVDYKHSHQGVVDHIVPLVKIHEQFKGNYALTDKDIKNIANKDTNYALTCAMINSGVGAPGKGRKLDMTNSKFVADQRKRKKEGRPHLGLSEEALENMLKMEKDAQKSLEKDANKSVIANLTGQGMANTGEIYAKATANAANQAKEYIVGNVILYLIKPLYYEISDIFHNGLKEGVDAETTMQAFSIRFGRIKNHVVDNAMAFIGDNAWEFVKGFISSLIEGVISLFVGIFKQVFKLIKEGIKVFVQVGKILFGKEASFMTPAQKGDAIIKLLGGSVISICGIGIETLLNKIGIAEPWSVVLSTMLSGIASAMFMLLLDKVDLFSVKAEKRRMRIEEIFAERIKDIKEAAETFDVVAVETMRAQELQFKSVMSRLWSSIESNSAEAINSVLFEMASFMNVDLGYSCRQDFIDVFDDLDNSL